jgi:hypothetical protein
MIISIHAEKITWKNSVPFQIKKQPLNRLNMDSNICLNGEKLDAFPLRPGTG